MGDIGANPHAVMVIPLPVPEREPTPEGITSMTSSHTHHNGVCGAPANARRVALQRPPKQQD